MSRSVGASSSNPGVSTQTVRQLIEESHLDLVNLLTQHLTSILNPIMADTNSKYDYLANQVERVSRLVYDDNAENQHNVENRDENTLGGGNVRIVQRGQNAEQVLHEPEMKIDPDPFEVNSSFVEPCCFGINMAGFTSFEFDTSLGNFEENIRQVFPGVGESLLYFLMQQKLKDRDVSLCPRCNAVFDADVAALFEKERMKKELAHKEEQVRQRHGVRRTESSTMMAVPPTQMQWVGGSSVARFPAYNVRRYAQDKNTQEGGELSIKQQ
ncbi:hypothetical protein PIB30_066654 [Stylosanthes scabra]|uniref:Uncharacterized protein n=1 Tax=Stylosanthes scabra TaxID=79078 RepID=A0ABU6SMC8_9FABA|nr:hypothetical protein [Stylosanthes scabra]